VFAILSKGVENIFTCNLDNEDMLKEMMVKIGLEKINIQERVMVEALLDSSTIGLVMSLEFKESKGLN